MTDRTTDTPSSVEESKQALNEEFGKGWSIVHSSADRWWAFALPMVREAVDRVDLEADTAEELAEKIRAVRAR